MSKVTVTSLSKAYGGHDLFKGLGFELEPGMRLAVAGPNGCGKSTILRILAGVAEPDSGRVIMAGTTRVGYVTQELGEADLDSSLLAWVLSAIPSWSGFWKEWEKAAQSGNTAQLGKLSARQAELEHGFGYNPEHKARAVLTGLGFREDSLFRPLGELSGGWRERAKLGRVLLQGADVLLLDEPTNHLDMEAVEWLEDYVLGYQGALAFVAHDRWFLDRVATHVLFITAGRHVLRKGNFTDFLAWDEENARLRDKEAAKLEAKIEHEYEYIRKFRVKARKSAQAQSKLKRVEKMAEDLDRLRDEARAARPTRKLSFSLPDPMRAGKAVFQAVDLDFSYAPDKRLWPGLNFQIFRGRKIAVAAPNGAGKSTLLKLAAGQLKPSSGSVSLGANVKLGYFSQHQTEVLQPQGTVYSEARRMAEAGTDDQTVKDTLGLFMLGEAFFDRSVSALSGGEKSRLLLATLFLQRANFLVLDEPTNHLDLDSRQGLVAALKGFEGSILMVAHDRWLISEVADEIWALTMDGFVEFTEFSAYERFHREGAGETAPQERDDASKPARRLDKEEKRRQAEIRNAMHRKLKPLQDEYAAMEKRFDESARIQSELEERLSLPETYANSDLFGKLHEEYRTRTAEVEELFEHLHGLEERIGALEAERDRLLEDGE